MSSGVPSSDHPTAAGGVHVMGIHPMRRQMDMVRTEPSPAPLPPTRPKHEPHGLDRSLSIFCASPYANRKRIAIVVFGLLVLIGAIVIGSSVQTSPDNTMSVLHNRKTGKLDKEVRVGAAVEVGGPESEFLSLPLGVRSASFHSTESRGLLSSIQARTREGMEIKLELTVDFQLDRTKAYEIITTFGYHGEKNAAPIALYAVEVATTRAIRGITRNVVSNYTTSDFLNGNRTIIGHAIQEALSDHLPRFYVHLARSSLGQISLNSAEFESEFKASQKIEFLLREAHTQRHLAMAEEVHANETQRITLRQMRDQVILEAERRLEAAKLGRAAGVVEAENAAVRSLIAANTTTIVKLAAARARRDRTKVARTAALSHARRLSLVQLLDAERQAQVDVAAARAALARVQREREAALLVARSQISIAHVEANIRRTQAKTAALQVLGEGYARANGTARVGAAAAAVYEQTLAAETASLTKLITSTGAAPQHATAYRYASTHAALLNRSQTLFLDYDRKPGALDALSLLPSSSSSSSSAPPLFLGSEVSTSSN